MEALKSLTVVSYDHLGCVCPERFWIWLV